MLFSRMTTLLQSITKPALTPKPDPKNPVKTSQQSLTIRVCCLSIFTVGLLGVSFFPNSVWSSEAKPKLYVASYDSFVSQWGPGPKLKALFEQSCQCEVQFTTAIEGVALLNRIKIQQKHFKADVVIGLDTSLSQEAINTGFFQRHNLKLSTVATAQRHTSIAHNDVFIPIDKGYFSFIYDQKRVPNPPKSMAELINGDLSIAYPDPRVSTVGKGLVLWMNQLYPNNTDKVWKQLAKHTVTVPANWSESYALMLEGEVDLALSYHSSPAYHQIVENRSQYQAALFEEGHYQQIETAAMSRHSQQQTLAQDFLAFLLSPTAQKVLALNNWMMPVYPVATQAELDQLPLPKPLNQFTPEILEQQSKHWLLMWRSHSL